MVREELKSSGRAKETDSRGDLIRAAQRLFAARGFDGTTIKDLADEAGVNVSMVSYFFGGKEGLYKACLEEVGKFNLGLAERVLAPAQTEEEFRIRLRLYFNELFEVMRANPEVTRILHRECDSELRVAKEVFVATFLKSFKHLIAFIESARKQGLVRENLDPLIATSILFGGFTHFCRMESMGKEFFGTSLDDPEFRERFLNQTMELVLNALETR